ncbi:MAG: amidohydrolase, partial [Alphaproteobacteria bacterium]|nr:amidohydrolase [Alphaproteobacteria bacterium]
MDLVIRNVRPAAAPEMGPVDIAVEAGRIVALGPQLAVAGESYDGGGRLACAGLIET